MCEAKHGSMAKETLKSLCTSHGWSYGVFWGFDQRNSLLLTLQDAYYEEQMGAVIDEMLLQVHILGGGIIGQAAFTKKHKWMFSDHANHERKISFGSSNNSDLFVDDAEFERQFSAGIKTIAVMSVEPLGVLQFGSTNKLPERTDFVDQARKLFQGIEVKAGIFSSQYSPSSSSSVICGLGGSSTSSICENPHFVNSNVLPTANNENIVKESCYLEDVIQSLTCNVENQRMTSDAAISFLSEDLFENVSVQAQFNSCSSQFDIQLQQPMFQSAGFFTSFQDSCLTSTWEDLPSDMSIQDFDFVLSTGSNHFEYGTDATQSFQESSALSSLHGFGVFANGDKTTEQYCTPFVNHDTACPINGYEVQCLINQRNDGTVNTIKDNQLDTMGIISASADLNEQLNFKTDSDASVSILSSITNAFNAVEKGNFSSISPFEQMTDFVAANRLFKNPGNRGDVLNPVVSGHPLDFSTSNSGWTSGCVNEPRSGPSNRLFSKLGLDQLLDGALNGSSSFAGSVSDDQLSGSNKRRKLGSSSGCNYLANPPAFSSFDKSTKLVLPECGLDRTSDLGAKGEAITKLDTSILTGDRCSINACNTILPVKGNQKSSKPSKKKAKPGTRPIPKDRQLIYERLSDLRELIPNGEKMSIDRLLHRTVKHLLFLQGATKHAEGLKKTEYLKDAKTRLENSKTNGNGVTWACEIGDQTVVCPLIVEDLSTPGQMLIEILCTEQGFFLEMVDIIRGFGLNILKGVMESRETNMWAQFVVEAEGNRLVSRHEIFSSLVQLLHLTSPSEVSLKNQLHNITGGRTAPINDCQKSAVHMSSSLPETIRCVI